MKTLNAKAAWLHIRTAFRRYSLTGQRQIISEAGICFAIDNLESRRAIGPRTATRMRADLLLEAEDQFDPFLLMWPATKSGAARRVHFIDAILAHQYEK